MDFIDHRSTANFIFSLSATDEKFRITSDGDVGIGTSSPSTKLEVNGVITTAGLTTTADINFGDNDKAIFGAGSDLQIYHNASDSYIDEVGTGNLLINANDLRLRDTSGNPYFLGNSGAEARLYYAGATKFQTTSTGIDVTGNVVSDGLTVDGTANLNSAVTITSTSAALFFMESDTTDLNTRLRNNGGNFAIHTVDDSKAAVGLRFDINNSTGDISFYEDTGTTAKFFWDASAESLGIGTSSPSKKLSIKADGGGSQLGIDIHNEGTATGDDAVISFETQGSREFTMGLDRSATSFVIAESSTLGSNQRLVIDDSGNVGIGTSSPERLLHVDSGGTIVGALIQNTSAVASRLALMDANTTNSAKVGIGATGDTLGLYAGGTVRATVDASGNVGIGTNSPSSLLHLSKGTGGTGSSPIEINIDTTYNGSWTADTDWGHINFRVPNESSTPDGDTHIQIAANSGSSTSGAVNDLVFRVKEASGGTLTERLRIDYDGTISFADKNASEAMRIDSSGNLLVGKTANDNTTAGFKVQSGGFFSAVADGTTTCVLNRLTSDGEIAIFRKDGTTVGSIGVKNSDLTVGNGDTGLRFVDSTNQIWAVDTTDGSSRDAAVDLGNSTVRFKDLYLSGGLRGDTLTFKNLAGSERTRIDSSGNQLWGKTSADNTTQGIRFLGSSGFMSIVRSNDNLAVFNRIDGDGTIMEFRTNGTTRGSISISGSTTSYNITSDERAKENIVDAPSASDDIDAIQVRSFDWKADGLHQKYGMVAQELQSVAPEAVSGDADSDDMMGVDYSKLVPMMLKEIQSLRARVAQLEGEN